MVMAEAIGVSMKPEFGSNTLSMKKSRRASLVATSIIMDLVVVVLLLLVFSCVRDESE